ncbi:MAG TPA: glycosyltransferase [Kiritimatiellia bacterium]|nr:glycosyltransferase [Kiritimatiellia bacterium]
MPPVQVSVVLPVYNRREGIERALVSVVGQAGPEVEVVVVDDGSTDGTAEWLGCWDAPQLRVIRLERNGGQAAARNAGVKAAGGEWVAFQDADDEWLPNKLARQVEAVAAHRHVDMVYGDLLRIPETGEPFVLEAPDLVKGRVMDQRTSGYAAYGLGIQSTMIRREVFLKLGGLNERMRCFEDLEFFLRFTLRHEALRLRGPVVKYFEMNGVSKKRDAEMEARRHLLLRFLPWILMQRPTWLFEERANLRHGRRLDR